MTYETTVGWSELSSSIVTLLLSVLPGDSVRWGVELLPVGLAVLYLRREDAFSM
jgi:hypothetical protein